MYLFFYARYPDATYISSKDAWSKLASMDGWPKVISIYCMYLYYN